MELWFSEHAAPGHKLSLRVKRALYQGKSEFQEIAVLETEEFGNVLVLDGLFQTTERDEYVYHELIAHVPMMAHPAPKRVLIVGGGDGGTLREVLRHPGVEHADMCEIDGEVIAQSKRFLPTIACKLDDPRATVHVADAIEFVKDKTAQYDVVIVDSSDPVGPGEGLFTTEFYTDVKRALKPGGVVCVQTESPFAMEEQMGRAYRHLFRVFPRVEAFIGTVPTYPGALWSWAFCSDGPGAQERVREADFEALEAQCTYYNRDIHRGAFALPTYVQRRLKALRELALAVK
jgi:spermidine synthase